MKLNLTGPIAAATMAVSLFFVGGAAAYSIAPTSSTIQTAAIMPLSMQYFCAQNPGQCRKGGAAEVTMTPNLMAVLKQVNSHVNRSIRPARDTSDSWDLNPASGDCEDYVLSKRAALMNKGISAGALRIAYTHTRRGEPHAVLVVRTSQGDYVLDNLNGSVKTLRASGYNIRSMSTANPTQWSAG